jgi:hypothetical protein
MTPTGEQAYEGWGSVSSKNCGNLVKLAIEKANRNANQQK